MTLPSGRTVGVGDTEGWDEDGAHPYPDSAKAATVNPLMAVRREIWRGLENASFFI